MRQTSFVASLQDDPTNAGVLKQRRALLESSDDSEDADEDQDENEEDDEDDEQHDRDEDSGGRNVEEDNEEIGEVDADVDRQGQTGGVDAVLEVLSSKVSGRSNVWASADAEKDSDGEDGEGGGPQLEKHHKQHKKHHKKHKHKGKKHRKDRDQCRVLEGLSRSIVKFGTRSGEYLAVSRGNNTCYQAVTARSHICDVLTHCSFLCEVHKFADCIFQWHC